MEDIKDKVKKLLRLADSSNEHEAKLAMAKAQELLAKHKLSMSDVELKEMKVEHRNTGIFYSERKDKWKSYLIHAIAELYCVENYINTAYHSSKHEICIIGMSNDIDVCLEVFNFAAQSIEEWFVLFKESNGWKYSTQYLNAIKNTYGKGFAAGVNVTLKEQMEEKQQEWGLVMVTPKEATDFKTGLSMLKSKAVENSIQDVEIERSGYIDGLQISVNDKLSKT